MKIKRRTILKTIRIITYLLIITSLLLLRFTNIIRVNCYVHDNIGILCPTCGITRAMRAITNFDFKNAVEQNAYGTVVLFPTFIILFVDDVICMLFKKKSLIEIILGE